MPSSQQILIVESEPMAEIFGRMLAPHYRMTTVPNAEEALRFLGGRGGLLTLVVAELELPRMSGRRLAEIIADKFPEAVVLFLVDYPVHTWETIPGPYLAKPFGGEALVQAAGRLLARHRRRYVGSDPYFRHVRALLQAVGVQDRLVQRHSRRVHELLYPRHRAEWAPA